MAGEWEAACGYALQAEDLRKRSDTALVWLERHAGVEIVFVKGNHEELLLDEKFLRGGIEAKDVPVARKDGDAEQALAKGVKIVEAEYYAPYVNHATMEPQTATALVKDGRVEVWVGTQNGETSIAAASEAAGVPLEQVFVHKMHAGGGFGRGGGGDGAAERAQAWR